MYKFWRRSEIRGNDSFLHCLLREKKKCFETLDASFHTKQDERLAITDTTCEDQNILDRTEEMFLVLGTGILKALKHTFSHALRLVGRLLCG